MLEQEPSEPKPMQRKIFCATFMALGLIADFALPIWWARAVPLDVCLRAFLEVDTVVQRCGRCGHPRQQVLAAGNTARRHLGGEEIGEGLTELKVRIRQPAVEHQVRMKDFRRWLESQGKTPAECTRKRKLVALAKGGSGDRQGTFPPQAYSMVSGRFSTR